MFKSSARLLSAAAASSAGSKITFQNGKLQVPNDPIIPYIEGDGIGKEITESAHAIFDAAVASAYPERRVHWKEFLAGGKAYELRKEWLPEETLEAFKTYLVGMKGPLTTPTGGGIRSLNVALRQTLDLFVCLRPVRWFKGVGSPLLHPEWVDMVIFRENTEDIYSGIEWAANTPEVKKVMDFLKEEMKVNKIRFPNSSAIGIKNVSREGSERLVRSAIEYALERNLPSVTLVHKGNIMKFTEGGFKRWGYELAEREFGDKVFTVAQQDEIKKNKGKEAANAAMAAAVKAKKLIVKDCICDAFLQNTLLKPKDYSVIATMNLNGDYVSDQLAAMVGGIGIAPGANVNYSNGYAIFEATHGTAPDIAGTGKANPSSLLLSGVMMFDHLGWPEVGKKVVEAMERLFAEGKATCDLTAMMPKAQTLSTVEFTKAVIANLNSSSSSKL